MRRVRPELADDAQHHRLGLLALEGDLALAEIGLDAIEPAKKIVVPEGAAVFAVGDRFETRRLLLLDERLNLAILDGLELLGGDFVLLPPDAGVLQRGGAKQAADMVGAERRFGTLHNVLGGLRITYRLSWLGLTRPSRLGTQCLPKRDHRVMPPRGSPVMTGSVFGHFPHTSSASSTIIRSFAHCSPSASTLPSSVEANPHCGDRQIWSSGTYFDASSMRRLSSSLLSSVPLFEVTRPSTTIFPLGTKRKGSKPPARALSNSMK